MNTTKLYHEDVYMPEEFLKEALHLQTLITTYSVSRHFREQHQNENDYKHYLDFNKVASALTKLKTSPVKPFEIEITQNDKSKSFVTKYVVRVSYDSTRDITIVIIPEENKDRTSLSHAFIKTAWLNRVDDVHKTLDASKYCTR